jgi:hypothetical protein
MSKAEVVDFSGAAIVCSHIALNDAAIMRGRRDEPLDAEDSGWQFTCGKEQHNDEDEAEVWSLNHVIRKEPSLRPFLQSASDTTVERTRVGADWEIVSK